MAIPELNANSVLTDQTWRSAASDLVLHCLQCPFYRIMEARHKWVNNSFIFLVIT